MKITESQLRARVRKIIREDSSFGDEWLSPQVVNFLVDNYAKKSSLFGRLKWEYGKLRGRTWGRYTYRAKKLKVNKAKTRNLFKQQVNTILHEIQHWNQHVDWAVKLEPKLRKIMSDRSSIIREIDSQHSNNHRWDRLNYGYRDSPHEVDARRFAEENVEAALSRAGKFSAGKIETESEDEAWNDIFDELTDLNIVTRRDIGQTLVDYDMNSPVNMQHAISHLRDVWVAIR